MIGVILLGILTGIGVLYILISTVTAVRDLKEINRKIQENRVIYSFTLYEDISQNLIKPLDFLRMKNRGNDLCGKPLKFPYVEYDIDDFFV